MTAEPPVPRSAAFVIGKWPTFALAMVPVLAVHLYLFQDTEPFFNNDETRHLMTGVFFRDFLHSGSYLNPKQFAVDYYLQYPALGLLVWPPGLHIAEGLWFLIVGPSFLAGRILIELFFVASCFYLFRLVVPKFDRLHAAFTVVLFGIMPLVVPLSRHIMAEIPTLAWVLASIFHFERYLDQEQSKDAWWTGLFAAFAALTRFDAVLLLPYFAVRLLSTKRLGLLKKRPVIGGIILSIVLTAPYYWLTWKEYGDAAHTAAVKGTDANSTGFLSAGNFFYYPFVLPWQMGWFLFIPALLSFTVSCLRSERSRTLSFLTLIIAVYITFSPLAELDPRHTIYWLPAWSFFAVERLRILVAQFSSRRARWCVLLLGFAILFFGTLWDTFRRPVDRVFGYSEAARYVVEHTTDSQRILIDAFLNGGFIYDVRRFDNDRRLTVLRGDKLIYGMISDPHGGYAEHVKGPAEILPMIFDYDPAYIVLEQLQNPYFETRGERWLREAVSQHPERFRLERTIEICSNRTIFEGGRLEIYRNLERNPNPRKEIGIPMLNTGIEIRRQRSGVRGQ